MWPTDEATFPYWLHSSNCTVTYLMFTKYLRLNRKQQWSCLERKLASRSYRLFWHNSGLYGFPIFYEYSRIRCSMALVRREVYGCRTVWKRSPSDMWQRVACILMIVAKEYLFERTSFGTIMVDHVYLDTLWTSNVGWVLDLLEIMFIEVILRTNCWWREKSIISKFPPQWDVTRKRP